MHTTQELLRILCAVCLIGAANAESINPHDVYESKCARCHAPHAGAFVFEALEISDGLHVGKASRQHVPELLGGGHGGLTPDEIKVMSQFFWDISQSGRLFNRKCSICHGNANDLAHFDLYIRDGVLVGRYSGRVIGDYLSDHGCLSPSEIPLMLNVLERQRRIYQ